MAITKLQPEGLAKPVDLADNEEIRLGTGNDLKIYHNGTDSYIDNENGYLYLNNDSSGIRLKSGNTWANGSMAAFYADGAVELYHDNAKKLETSSAGVTVTGNLTVSANINIAGYSENHFAPLNNSAVDLGFSNKKWRNVYATTLYGDGSNLTGISSDLVDDTSPQLGGALDTNGNQIVLGDGGPGNSDQNICFGNDKDLKIYHDGANSAIYDNGGGRLKLYTNGTGIDLQKDDGEYLIHANIDGAVGLYYNNHKAFETTDFGSQTVFSSAGGSTPIFKVLHGNLTQGIGIGYDSINSVGTSTNVPLFLRSKGTGNVEVVTSGGETMAKFIPDSNVELYHNNTREFMTVNGGCAIGINAQMNSSKLSIAKDGTHLSLRSFATGGYDSIIFRSANTTVGKVHFNSGGTQYHTSSDYRRKDNIVNLTGAIDRVKTLLPKRFNFKTEPSVTRDGFLAHEVTTVPEAVLGIKDQIATEKDVEDGKAEAVGDPIYQTIDQSALVPLLTAAVKELIAKVEVLEAA